MNTENQKMIDKINEVLKDKNTSPKDVLELGKVYIRELIYKQHPNSDPKVVEALLLMYENICYSMFEEIDKTAKTEEIGERLIKEMTRFANSLDKTIKTLSGN